MMVKYNMSRTINLIVSDDEGDEIGSFIVDDGETGLDIRSNGQCKIEADSSAVIDIYIGHCSACHEEKNAIDMLGLTQDEADVLSRWRTRKQEGIDAKVLGEILDKVVRSFAKKPIECSGRFQRIVLEVESAS